MLPLAPRSRILIFHQYIYLDQLQHSQQQFFQQLNLAKRLVKLLFKLFIYLVLVQLELSSLDEDYNTLQRPAPLDRCCDSSRCHGDLRRGLVRQQQRFP